MDSSRHMAENSGLLLVTALAVSVFFSFLGYLLVIVQPIAAFFAILFGAPLLWWVVGKLMQKPLEK